MRPLHGSVGRRPCLCTAQAAWNAISGSTSSKVYPPLTYSVNRRDITGVELGMLLAVSRPDAVAGPAAIPLCRQNYSYWRSAEGLHHAAKLEVALRRSVATVACFTTWDVYGEESDCDSPSGMGSVPVSAGHQLQSAMSYHEPPSQSPGRQQQQQREEEKWNLAMDRQLQPQRSGSWGRATAAPATAAAAAGTAAGAAAASGSSQGLASLRSGATGPDGLMVSSSSSRSSSPQTSARRSKPSPPPGVPDMDWNWMLPSAGGGCSRGSNISNGSSARSFPSGSGSRSGSDSGSAAASNSTGSASSVPSSSSSLSSSHQQRPHQWRWQTSAPASFASACPRRKSLVGFARASGDNSLVATIYDVAVHPAVQGQGIGRRLVKLLVQQIQARSVYDIGVVTPVPAAGFWQRCSFDDDREDSTFMMFMGRPTGQESSFLAFEGIECTEKVLPVEDSDVGLGAPRSPQELLAVADLGFWDSAQRSESLQALLAARLRCFREAEMGLADGRGRTGQGGEGRVRWGPRKPR